MTSEYLQGWSLQSLPGQPVPMLGHPLSEKGFPAVCRELCFSVCPLPLALSLGLSGKSLERASLLCVQSLQVPHTLIRYPPHHLSLPRAQKHPQLSLTLLKGITEHTGTENMTESLFLYQASKSLHFPSLK